MSTLLGVAVGAVAIWLVVMTIALMLCVRQLGALTVRMRILAVGNGGSGHGSSIGFRISDDLARLEPALAHGRRVVLLISATCSTCAELVHAIRTDGGPSSLDLPDELLVVLPGDPTSAPIRAAAAAFEGRGHVIFDPIATTLARGLKMANVPSALVVESGLITGNLLFVEDLDQIDRLVGGLSALEAPKESAVREPTVSASGVATGIRA